MSYWIPSSRYGLQMKAMIFAVKFLSQTYGWQQRTCIWTSAGCCEMHERNPFLLHEAGWQGYWNALGICFKYPDLVQYEFFQSIIGLYSMTVVWNIGSLGILKMMKKMIYCTITYHSCIFNQTSSQSVSQLFNHYHSVLHSLSKSVA